MTTQPNSPLLSIVVTAHNAEAWLDACLASVVSAAEAVMQVSQIVLIDDASEDRTYAICQRFSQQYANVDVHQVAFRNIGKVRNFALAQCTGQYVTMIDGDDEIIPGAFEQILPLLRARQPDALLTRLHEVYPSSRKPTSLDAFAPVTLTRHEAICKFLVHRELQAHFIGQFFRRDLLAGLAFPAFRCYEDAWLFPAVLARCSAILFAASGPYLYFKRADSLSTQIDPEKVNMLIQATEQMSVAFGERYRNLIACHWITILNRHQHEFKDEADNQRVQQVLRALPALDFLCDRHVRTSFKKKYLALRLRGAF